MKLRDGSTTEDPRLDRLVEFDERSRNFAIRQVTPADVKPRTWRLKQRLDQGAEGACVGFGWTHELDALPFKQDFDATFAREQVYWPAQRIDPWPGGSYPGASPVYEGTSVLAGAKTVQSAGYIGEYRWAFSVEDVLRALTHEGPVVLGTWWYASMFEPRPSGLLTVDPGSGRPGGHCYMLRGWRRVTRLPGEDGDVGPCVRVTNSWGPDWGVNGEAFIRLDDLATLLADDGEACVPMARTRPSRRPSAAARRPHPALRSNAPWRPSRG